MRETLVKTEEFEDSPVEKIPKDWEIVSLKNEINILHGYAFEGEYFADEPPGDVLLVPGNFHRDGGLYFDDNNTKYYRGLIPDGTVLENGQLLIVMTDLSPRTLILGRVVLLELPFRVLHNQRIGKIVPKLPNTWDKRFLLLVMNSDRVRRNIISNATGTTVRHTSPDRIIANVVPKPPVEEQSKIADILDTIDVAIAHTSSLIAKLKQMKAGLLHDLLTRGLDENGELRDAIAHPEQFKDSPLGQIPKAWKCLTINDCLRDGIIVDVQDRNHGEAHPKTDDFVSEGIPFVMAKDLLNGQINLAECHKITWHQYQSLRIGFARPGDVLLSHKGTIGLIAMVPNSLQHIMLTPQVTYYRVSEEKHLLGKFLFCFFHSPLFQQRLEVLSAQSTRSYIGITLQKTLSILIPPPEEQSRIVEIFDTHNTRIRTEESYREKLKLQKQGLMHDLLTGKVRVKDA